MWAELEGLVGVPIDLETTDGCTRTGELTGITWRSVKVQGVMLKWPRGLILNGDPNDELPWDQLLWVEEHGG